MLSVEKLTALGLTPELANKVSAALVAATKETTSQPNPFQAEIERLKKTVSERDAQLAELQKFQGDAKALEDKIKKLQADNEKQAKEHAAAFALERKKSALRIELLSGERKPLDVDIVMSLVNMERVNLDNDGKISGLKEQYEALLKDKSFLFEQPATTQGDKPQDAGFKISGSTPQTSAGVTPARAEKSIGELLGARRLESLGITAAKTATV